jgi:hypothetical protein
MLPAQVVLRLAIKRTVVALSEVLMLAMQFLVLYQVRINSYN